MCIRVKERAKYKSWVRNGEREKMANSQGQQKSDWMRRKGEGRDEAVRG
jgi:hypothetical protein